MLAASTLGAAAAQASVATAPRVPELVSPTDKGGNDIFNAIKNTAGGDAIAYTSLGGFAGVQSNMLESAYRSHRTATGWVTDGSLTPAPGTPAPGLGDGESPVDLNADLTTAYYSVPSSSTLSPLDQNALYDVVSVTGGRNDWLTPSLTLPDTSTSGDSYVVGHSADGGHVIIESAKQLIPSVAGGVNRVYDSTASGLRLVSVAPSTGPNPADEAAHFGAGRTLPGYSVLADAGAISQDGSRIYFQMDGQLYVRIDGRTTSLVSASRVAGDPRAAVAGATTTFEGASADGRVVIFASDKRLTTAATTGGLYMYDEDDDALRQLASIDPATTRSVLGSVRTAPDGSRVYFVSDAALATGATDGQPNLYVAGDTPVRFIATLAASDSWRIWGTGEYNNQIALSPDGRSLAFPSTDVLAGPRTGQVDSAPQLYLYSLDADALSCVSCPPGGAVPTGESSLRDVPGNQQMTPAGFAADGTLFFNSPDRLTADDTDAKYDVYAHDADGDHLVSTGTPDQDVVVVGSSADGRDVFVRTRETLAGGDHDGGLADIYDLRIGGGFPSTAVAPCVGEACRGPQSPQPAAPAAPASLTATDTSKAASSTTPVTTFTLSSISAAARAGWARTGKVTLSVRVGDAAQVTAKATAALPGSRKATTVASATKLGRSAGTVKLVLTLSAQARSALKRSHKLTVKVAVTVTGGKKAANTTVVLKAATR